MVAIARNGHVYGARASFASLDRTGGILLPALIGITRASTFSGFCQRHDASAFAPLEANVFGPTREQAFLLAYRALLRELYMKTRHLEALPLFRDTDKGLPVPDQLAIQSLVSDMKVGVEKALADLHRHKRSFDGDFLAGDHSGIRYVAFDLDRTPDIVCSGVFQPTESFTGHQIQDLGDLETELDFASFSLMANSGRGAAVFAWRSDSDRAASQLVDSLLTLPRPDMPNALVRFTFSTLENTFWSPLWWEGLSDDSKRAAIERINYGVSPVSRLRPRGLADDGQRFVDWVVVGIRSER